MISFEKKFIFLHIPKTAGTSIEIAIEDDSCVFKRGQWSPIPLGFGAPLNHLTLTQIVQSSELTPNQFNSFFKFAFVRNPWDKVISECFCGQIQGVFKDCNNIKDKIKKVCSLASSGYGGHFLKQSNFIKSPKIELDFIGRFEHLEHDLDHICNHLSISRRNLSHKHKSPRTHYREYFDGETIDLVSDTYEEDINFFNYSF